MSRPKLPKKPGKAGRLPPLSASDLVRMLHRDGWGRVDGTKHLAFEHPYRPGKVNIDVKWTELKFRHIAMRGVMAQAGWTKDDVRRLYFER